MNFWRRQWGNDLWFSHCSERSAGVLTLKHRLNSDVLHTDIDPKGHFICQVIDCNKIFFIILNVYGYNTSAENIQLFVDMEIRLQHWLLKFPNSYIVMGGDFNVILNPLVDRWPHACTNTRNTYLKSFMDTFDLLDVWRVKFPDTVMFTWNNKDNTRLSRIDYWLVSNSINEQNISVNVFPCPLSDHKAISIYINIFPSDKGHEANYWKLNNSLLGYDQVKTYISQLISQFFSKAKVEN